MHVPEVAVSARTRRRAPVSLLIVLLAAGCAGVRSPATPAAPGGSRSSPLITTFWCGPPLDVFDDRRAAEIAAAGFTVVGAPCEEPITAALNLRALDVAARHGLKMWVRDGRYDERARAQRDWETGVAAAVAEYGDHPAFGGYFVADEPSVDQFDDLAAIVARLHALDPDGLAYVNLLPDYAQAGTGAPTYGDYVERFLSTVRPRLLSYDYYAFGEGGRDRPTFFANLSLVREQAIRHKVPFLLIGLAMPHGGYRDPSAAEIRWQMFHALAYGARGVSYFAYWTPVNVEHAGLMKFRHGLIENGRPTRHYAEAARLNRELHGMTRALEGFRSVGVADSRGEVAARLPLGPVAAIDGGAVMVGLFEDSAGRRMTVLVNRDYERSARIAVRAGPGQSTPERLEAGGGGWQPVLDPIALDAGGAVLLRRP
jgi:hypothetical protein